MLLLERAGERLRSLAQFPGGANSLVFRAEAESGRVFLLKRYLQRPGDESSRLGTEFEGLSFLWAHGVRAIPEPLASIPGEELALYRFIPGRKLEPGEVGRGEVEAALGLVDRLVALGRLPAAAALPRAKESCRSLEDYLGVVRTRVSRLAALPPAPGPEEELAVWLAGPFHSFLERAESFARETYRAHGLDPAACLPRGELVLSPSDFGFHNAIRREPGGDLVFIDFEYWGWDDPAKLVADFFLQPAVPVPAALRSPFFRGVAALVPAPESLRARLAAVHLLSALKWCLIMLNVFGRPEADAPGGRERCALQLGKARGALAALEDELRRRAFPLGGA
jgi:hypothetical protein